MKTICRRAIAFILLAASGIASAAATTRWNTEAEATPATPPQAMALIGATICTQTDAGDFAGTIVIKDGKIAAIGPNAAIPADAIRIDATNHVITPGLIDARSVLWLNSNAARESGSNGNLNILDGVDPFAEDWHDAARQGVTAVYIQPAGSGRFGGNGAVLKVGPCNTADDLVVRSPAGVQATLGIATAAPVQQDQRLAELAARFGIQLPQQPQQQAPAASNSLTRYAQYEQFKGLFDSAKRYGESKPSDKDAAKELLLLALKREIPLRLETNHEDDIRNTLKMTSDLNLRTIYDRLDKVKVLPDELAARKDGIIVGPNFSGKKAGEIRKLALDGRKFAIGTHGDDPRATTLLRALAAAAINEGYPRERVLQALTRDAAEMHGVEGKLGSLAEGRVADLVVFAGDPLDPSVPVRMTISQGAVTYDNPKAEVAPRATACKPNVPDALPNSYIIKTTRLLNEHGEFVPGELFVENGKVTDKAARNSAATTIDLGDAPVTPGLVSAHNAIQSESCPDADAGHLRGMDGVSPDDGKLRANRDAGFTTSLVAPGSANVIAGVSSAIRAGDATSAHDCGLKFVLSSAARHTDRYPASLVGQVELINDRLRGAPSKTELFIPFQIAKTLLAERDKNLDSVRQGKMAAHFEASSRAEVRDALRIIAEHKLRGVILMPKQLDDLLDDIRGAGVGVVIGPLKTQDPEKLRTSLVELAKTGTPIAFGGGDASELRTTAAQLVNAGMPRNVARRGLVAGGAERFGLPSGVGRLSPGDAADFVVWDGDLLDPGSKPAAVVIQGHRIGK